MAGALAGSVNLLRGATKSALTRTKKIVSGNEKDKLIKIYEKMRPENFNDLAELYGGDNVLRYIRHMEARRIKSNGA